MHRKKKILPPILPCSPWELTNCYSEKRGCLLLACCSAWINNKYLNAHRNLSQDQAHLNSTSQRTGLRLCSWKPSVSKAWQHGMVNQDPSLLWLPPVLGNQGREEKPHILIILPAQKGPGNESCPALTDVWKQTREFNQTSRLIIYIFDG